MSDFLDEDRECSHCGDPVEPDWVGPHVHFSRWTGPLITETISARYQPGVAFRVRHHSIERQEVIAIPIGDDREWRFSTDDIIVIARESFCGECGQIGCTHDGLDRDHA